MLLAALGTSIANVGLPILAEAFDATFQQVQWVVLAYLLSVTALVVGAGRLGDLAGRRRLLLAGIALFAAGSALSGLAPGLAWLIAARGVQGAGAAIMMALTLSFVAEVVPKDRTGSAMGLLGSMSAVGTALGPPLGGWLIAGFGWRAIFLATAPGAVLLLMLAWRALPADRIAPRAGRPGFDLAGTLLLTATLAFYALAMTMGGGRFGPQNLALLLAAALGLCLFLAAQQRAASPLIRLSLLRDPALRIGLSGTALVATVMMATLVVGPFHLARGLGLDTPEVGLAMSAGPLVAAICGVPAGRMVDRFGARRMMIAGLAGIATGSIALASLPVSLGVAGYVAPLSFATAGYAMFQAANNTAIMRDVPPAERGLVSGLLNLARNLGLVSGASLMGAVFAIAGMRATFAVAAVLMLVAIALLARRPS